MILASFFGEDTAAAAAAAAPSVAPAASVPASVAPAAAIVPPVVPSAGLPPMPVSQATRAPFQRPAAGRRGFIPQSLRTQFVPEFEPFPGIMHFPGARVPMAIRNQPRSEPGYETPVARPEDQTSLPASVPSPVQMNARMLPPNIIMALGIMPSVRGVRGSRVDPAALVAGGRKPTDVG